MENKTINEAGKNTIADSAEVKQPDYLYIPSYRVDLPYYVKMAIGDKRTYEDFAKECEKHLTADKKLSPAAISRIVTGAIKTPLEEVYLQAIADSSEGRVRFSSLMGANGMRRMRIDPEDIADEKNADKTDSRLSVKKEEIEKKIIKRYLEKEIERDKKSEEQFRKENNINRDIKEIIKNELSDRNCKLSDSTRKLYDMDEGSRFGLRYSSRGDFSFYIEEEQESFDWVYYFNLRGSGISRLDKQEARFNSGEGEYEVTASDEMYVMMTVTQGLFLTDIWDPGSLKNIRSSIVFIDKKTYELYCQQLQNCKVHSYISLILLDLDEGRFVSEYMLEREDGRKTDSLFTLSKKKKEKVDLRKYLDEDLSERQKRSRNPYE